MSPVEIPAISVAECMLDFNGFLVNNKKQIRLAEQYRFGLLRTGFITISAN